CRPVIFLVASGHGHPENQETRSGSLKAGPGAVDRSHRSDALVPPPTAMSPGTKKTLTRVLTVTGAVGLLLLIFRVVPFADVMRSIRSAEPTKLAIGFVLLFAARVVAAWRMKLLTDEQDLRLSLPEIFEIGTTSTFYGLI